MFAYSRPDEWEDYYKPKFIESTIQDICKNIYEKGELSSFNEVFDLLYEYIEDNLEKFLPDYTGDYYD